MNALRGRGGCSEDLEVTEESEDRRGTGTEWWACMFADTEDELGLRGIAEVERRILGRVEDRWKRRREVINMLS